jgi:hypothetical protein
MRCRNNRRRGCNNLPHHAIFQSLFATGCAGFAVLDDYNGIFLAATALSLFFSLYKGVKSSGRIPPATVIAIALALFLASMPHMLRLANDHGLSLPWYEATARYWQDIH